MQVIVLSWVYGIDRVFENLSQMNMRFSGWLRTYWWATWTLVTPIASFVSLLYNICINVVYVLFVVRIFHLGNTATITKSR